MEVGLGRAGLGEQGSVWAGLGWVGLCGGGIMAIFVSIIRFSISLIFCSYKDETQIHAAFTPGHFESATVVAR